MRDRLTATYLLIIILYIFYAARASQAEAYQHKRKVAYCQQLAVRVIESEDNILGDCIGDYSEVKRGL